MKFAECRTVTFLFVFSYISDFHLLLDSHNSPFLEMSCRPRFFICLNEETSNERPLTDSQGVEAILDSLFVFGKTKTTATAFGDE